MRWFLAVTLPWLLLPLPAVAEEQDWCRYHNVSCETPGTRVYAWRKTVEPKRERSRKRVALERREEREELSERRYCIGPRRAIGEEHVSREGAEAAADRAWEAAVSYDHGRRYMDLSSAKHVVHTCSRSRPSKDGIIGRQADAAGLFYMVCSVEAIPCRPSGVQDEDGK